MINPEPPQAARAISPERAYEQLLEPSAIPVFLIRNGFIAYANAAALRAFSLNEPDTIVGRAPRSLLHPASPDIFAELERSATVAPAQVRFRSAEGHVLDVELAAWRVPYGEGEATVVSFVDITDRKRAEDLRHRTADQLRLVIDGMPGLVSYIDRDYRYQFTNRCYSDWFLKPRDQFDGHLVRDVLGEESFRVVQPYMARALNGETVVYDSYLPYKDGKARHVHVSYVPDRAPDGEVRGLVVLVEDISDRVRANTALRASEERYRAFIQQSSEGIWRFELTQPFSVALSADEQVDLMYRDGYLAECNDAMAKMYGYERAEQLNGARLIEMLPRSDPHNEAYLRGFIESGYRMTNAESHELDRYGAVRFFSNNLIGIVEDGMLYRAWGMQQDETERRAMEQALRESEERYRFLAESIPQFIAIANDDGDLLYRNRALLSFTGTGKEANLRDIVHAEDLPLVLAQRLAPEQSGDTEYRLRRSDGAFHWVLGQIHSYMSDGQLRRWLVTAVDIEQRKTVEQELRRINAELEQYAYAASHDLQEPLRMVTLYAQLLRRRYGADLNQEAQSFLDVIERGGTRLGALVRDLLAYSQVIAGQELPRVRVDLNEVVATSLNNANAMIFENDAVVSSEPLPTILGEVEGLVRLFDNLITNAIKYRKPSERPQIHISASQTPPLCQISITDNGIGVPPQYQDRIWKMFRRLHGRTVPGTGIGLAISKKIVEQHGGEIWVESDGASGSRFCFTLIPADGSSCVGH